MGSVTLACLYHSLVDYVIRTAFRDTDGVFKRQDKDKEAGKRMAQYEVSSLLVLSVRVIMLIPSRLR